MNSNNRAPQGTPQGAGRGPGPGGPGGPPGGGRGPGGMMGPGEKAKDFKGSVGKLLNYLSPFKVQIIVVLFLAAIASVFSIVGPKIMALITDELGRGIMAQMTGAVGGIDFDYIRKIMLLLIGLYLISAVFSYVQGHIMANVSTKISFNLRNSIMQKINRMPLGYFHGASQGDVLSRITNDVDTVESSLSSSITQIVSSIATVLGVLVMMLTISWKLTLITLLVLPLSLMLVMGVVKKSQKHFVNQQLFLGRVNGRVEETYGGHQVVKAFCAEEKMLEQFDAENDELAKSARKAEFLSGMMMPLMSFVGNLGYVMVCIFGAIFAAGGSMSIGDIQAFIQYVRSFTQPIAQLANISNQLQRMVAAAERVFEFLDEKEGEARSVTVSTRDADITGAIEFKNVHFGYTPDKTVINDFSCDVKAGQKIAIVGPTGAGKTTMVKLLMRFYDIESGSILLDGHDIRDFDARDLRNMFAMVLQDTWLFGGTIMENIRYGSLGASDAAVIDAAKKAQADSFIRTLPDSYNMQLNEETTNVSQGQKQLLTIARAILSDPKILILDEATSSVDTRTELLIQKAMNRLMDGRTSFIIAHRLSTIREADLILCMNEGDIVEQGTHGELMALNGFYANLYNSQFEGASEVA